MADYAGKTRVVFVGNLPYDATEQEVQKAFEVAGPVVSFRHVFDRDNNKAKGFGFCEYYDVDTAASAVRNLNGVAEVRGRLLRVDFAQPDIKDLPKDQRGARDKNGLPPLPPGVILPPGVSPAESIHKTLQNMPPAQLLDVLHQMRGLVQSSPDQARALLSVNPQLCYALFQAMLMMNIVDPSVLQRMIVPGSQGSHNPVMPLQPLQPNAGGPPPPFSGQQGGPPPPPPQSQGGPPQHQPPFSGQYPPPQSMPSQQQLQQQPPSYPSAPGNFPMPPQQGQQPQPGGYRQPPAPASFPIPGQGPAGGFPPGPQQGPGNFPMPPQQIPGYGTPPHMHQPTPPQQPPQQQPPQQGAGATNPQQQALLQQVLSMTQQQIDMLPPDQRQTVMAIRASAGRM